MTDEKISARLENQSIQFDSTLGVSINGALELSTGRIVAERYKVLEELGRGGMGVVYRVEQTALQREMALKTLDGNDVKEITWQRFQQEAKASSMLDHPNLISVHDCGMIDGKHPYFVMDLVDGKTLAEVVHQKGCLSVEEALPIFIQVCFGLAYAHDLGIVHRDLKPSNIMISDRQTPGGAINVKIVDFGIAKLRANEGSDKQGLTKTGEIFGSPLYMSPEQCLGVAVDHRSDIYSFGCVLFEALTGTPPFMGSTALSTMMKHQSEKAPSLKEATLGKEFSPEMENIVASLLQKEPDKRYQSLKPLARDLSLIQQGISAKDLELPSDHNTAPRRKILFTSAETLIAIVVSTIIASAGTWFLKGKMDSTFYEDKLAAQQKVFDSNEFRYPKTLHGKSVESTTVTDATGKKLRRILFVKPVGDYNEVGQVKVRDANKLQIIPFERSIHLHVRNPDVLENPYFFHEFQADDVTELSIDNNISATDDTLKDAAYFKGITYLNASYTEISNESIKYINSFKGLTRLQIADTQITEKGILKLNCLKNLVTLRLGSLPSITKILEQLKGSTKLNTLYVGQCNLKIEDAKLIGTMPNIHDLSVDNNGKFNDECIQALKPLVMLNHLNLEGTNVKNFDAVVRTFPHLNHLNIPPVSDTKLKSLRETYKNVEFERQIVD